MGCGRSLEQIAESALIRNFGQISFQQSEQNEVNVTAAQRKPTVGLSSLGELRATIPLKNCMSIGINFLLASGYTGSNDGNPTALK
jgi:hypothetical protein